ncbi:hypothetical protein BC30048_2269 [Bacillus cereus]|nr:hypothetical protein BC30048_2269 [Bacillus cereus]
MYIFIGLSLLLILLIFLFAKKFTPNSFMMTSFKGNSFKTFSIGILIAAILSLSYGTYHAVTYQPSYLDIKLKNQNYTVFGNVGEFGYFSEELLKKIQKYNYISSLGKNAVKKSGNTYRISFRKTRNMEAKYRINTGK